MRNIFIATGLLGISVAAIVALTGSDAFGREGEGNRCRRSGGYFVTTPTGMFCLYGTWADAAGGMSDEERRERYGAESQRLRWMDAYKNKGYTQRSVKWQLDKRPYYSYPGDGFTWKPHIPVKRQGAGQVGSTDPRPKPKHSGKPISDR